jgi:hypothetical protein
MAFEIVDMNLDERSRLRRLLAESLASPNASESKDSIPVPSETPVPAVTRSR